MGNSRINAAALFLALVAGVFILGSLRSYGWLTGIGGLILLFVLFAYDQEGHRSIFQSVAFGSVCGFALMLIVAAYFHARAVGDAAITLAYAQYLPIAWACATLIFVLIDRTRMGSRFEPSRAPSTLGIATARYETPPPHAATTSPALAPVQPQVPVVQPERVPPQPVQPYAPAPEPVAAEPAPVPAPPITPERAVPIPHGKETSIYINLVGEGLALMRTVRAEHMGKDFYLITEPMPEGESWEFTTGQIVRCRKKNLSSGKGLVAVEEAPRAS
jgi:hypothetical protein